MDRLAEKVFRNQRYKKEENEVRSRESRSEINAINPSVPSLALERLRQRDAGSHMHMMAYDVGGNGLKGKGCREDDNRRNGGWVGRLMPTTKHAPISRPLPSTIGTGAVPRV